MSESSEKIIGQSAVVKTSAISAPTNNSSASATASKSATAYGGAISSVTEDLSLTDTEISSNNSHAETTAKATASWYSNTWTGVSSNHNAIASASASATSVGGAIYNIGGNITFDNVDIDSNTSTASAQAIASSTAELNHYYGQGSWTMAASAFPLADSISVGGALYQSGNNIDFSESNISNNAALAQSEAIASSREGGHYLSSSHGWRERDPKALSTARGGALQLTNVIATITGGEIKNNSATAQSIANGVQSDGAYASATASAYACGGALYLNTGEMSLDQTNISNNTVDAQATAVERSGLYSRNTVDALGIGGAIAQKNGVLDVKKSTFKNNSASVSICYNHEDYYADKTFTVSIDSLGGAIYKDGGEFSIKDSSFEGNTVSAYSVNVNDVVNANGGAIYIAAGTGTISNTVFSENKAKLGGAIYIGDNNSVNLTISDCSFLTESDTVYNAGSTLTLSGINSFAATIEKSEGTIINTGTFDFYVAGMSPNNANGIVSVTDVSWESQDFTITVKDSGQETGSYRLMYDASVAVPYSFTIKNVSGEILADSITVSSETIIKEDYSLKLYQEDTYVILDVSRPPITITADSASKTYDGTALAASGYTYTGSLAAGDTLVVTVGGSITDAGTGVSTVTSYKVMRGDVDVTSNYTFGASIDGTLTVNKRNVTLTSASDSREYDASNLTNNSVAVSGDGFVDGQGASFNVTGSQLDVGSSANSFTYTLNDGTNADNYNITVETGTLTVTPYAEVITITADSASKTYDGTALAASGYTYTGSLAAGDTLVVTVGGSITDAGTGVSTVTSYKVMRGDVDVTSNYTFGASIDGTLTVNKRNVTLTSASDSKEYDASNLTNNSVAVSGDGFVDGQGASFNVTGSQLDVGSSENTFSYTLNDGTNADNYNITVETGTLIVTPDITNPQIITTVNPETNNALSVTVNAIFSDVSLAETLYSFDNTNWHDYTGGIQLTMNNTIYFKAIDSAGNSTVVSHEVSNILPAVKIYDNGILITSGSVIAGAIISAETGIGDDIQISTSGTATDTKIYAGGTMSVFDGAVAYNTEVSGTDGNEGEITVNNGGSITSVDVKSNGKLNVLDGAHVENISAVEGAVLHFDVTKNTYANGVYLDKYFWLNGGVFTGYIENSTINVYSNCLIEETELQNTVVKVYDEGTAKGSTVGTRSAIRIYNGGIAKNNIIDGSAAQLQVFSGGVALNTTIKNGVLWIDENASASNTVIEAGNMVVANGGSTNNTTVHGKLQLQKGTTTDTLITSKGSVVIQGEDVYLVGKVDLSGILSADFATDASGADIILRLKEKVAQDVAFINNIDNLDCSSYTFQVKRDQDFATYNIASGAGCFDKKMLLDVDGIFTQKYLSVGVEKIYDKRAYLFSKDDSGNLTLSITQSHGPEAKRDFNESGISDIAVFDEESRTFSVIADQKDGSFAKYQIDAPVTDSSWNYLGTGYIDADNVQDVLWIHDSGEVGVWQVEGNNKYHQTIAGATSDWKFLTIADVTGDGRDNIIWQHESGTVLAWDSELNAAQKGDIVLGGVNTEEWNFAGTGDMTGDGVQDILWRHEDGLVGFWDSSNNQNWVSLGSADEHWQILETGDFDNDGIDELLWQNDSGLIGAWDYENGSVAWNSFGDSNTLAGYDFCAIGDYNGDSFEDILWCDGNDNYKVWSIENNEKKETMDITLA